MRRAWILGLLSLVVVACATSPLGRKQLHLFPEEQMAEMGATAYRDIQQQMATVEDPRVSRYVRCVADAVTAVLEGPSDWEVSVFRNDEPNAFALPGGKIGVNSGMLDVARNQDQLATVVAHEVAHVVAEHGNERISTAFATQTGLDLVNAMAGGGAEKQQLMSLLGLGAQLGIILPFSRTQEKEADLVGLDMMAKAGFDPRASIQLWQNMAQAGGGAPPEFLSTHPSGETRIDELQARMGHAMELYRQAQARGRTPKCEKP